MGAVVEQKCFILKGVSDILPIYIHERALILEIPFSRSV